MTRSALRADLRDDGQIRCLFFSMPFGLSGLEALEITCGMRSLAFFLENAPRMTDRIEYPTFSPCVFERRAALIP